MSKLYIHDFDIDNIYITIGNSDFYFLEKSDWLRLKEVAKIIGWEKEQELQVTD